MMKKLKEEVEKKGLKLSVTDNGKEGKSKMVASCRYLEEDRSLVGQARDRAWAATTTEFRVRSFEMFFATKKPQRNEAKVSLTTSRDSRRASRLSKTMR